MLPNNKQITNKHTFSEEEENPFNTFWPNVYTVDINRMLYVNVLVRGVRSEK